MARLAQSAERKALNLVVVGSSPTVGVFAGRVSNMVVVGCGPKLGHRGLNPGPSACKADVIPLHHLPGTVFRIGGLHVACWGPHPVVQHKRHRGDSNPCGQSPMDFESISFTARTQCHGNSRTGCTPNGAKPTSRATAQQ